jgi:hypothetical protein
MVDSAMYFEMNIRVGDGTPSAVPMKLLEDPVVLAQMQEAAITAVIDGYTHLVYNFIRSGDTILQQHDECLFKPFDLAKLW